MKTYIALLRGINVGGHKKILMKDLSALFESIGFVDITIYIQSGNVVFKASGRNTFAKDIESAIQNKYDFNVSVLIKTPSEIETILMECPFSEEKKVKSYFILLETNPLPENLLETSKLSNPNEEFTITNSCVYIYYDLGAGKSKLGTNFFERNLKSKATARNYRTMAKLIELSTF